MKKFVRKSLFGSKFFSVWVVLKLSLPRVQDGSSTASIWKECLKYLVRQTFVLSKHVYREPTVIQDQYVSDQ